MAREIKFRAWDVECKKMILPRDKRYHQYFMSFCGNIFLRTTESMSCFGGGDQLHWSMREKILMQYTGLTDKNGVEIYEGDIVTALMETPPRYDNPDDCVHRIKEQVKFEYGSFLIGPEYLWGEYIGDIEIIGNIHENPELLEGK